MAEQDITLLKRTKISVVVDEALPDILVVTYEFGVKIFKGVLLDSTKKNLPYGVPNINPAFNTPTKNPDDDTLYAVNQRFAYMDPNASKKKNVQMPSKYKNNKINKMTVRLRPRQVLCSKCKGICNENSENVSRKRKASEGSQSLSPPPARRNANAPVTRSANIMNSKKGTREKEPSLVPKLTRLTFQEEGSVGVKLNLSNRKLTDKNNQEDPQESEKKQLNDSSESGNSDDDEVPLRSKRLMKKRSTSSAGEQWDDTSQQENANRNNNELSQMNSNVNSDPTISSNVSTSNTTRTIKISYGPQGEGTVLKIPAKIENLSNDDDSEENKNIEPKPVDNKAVRRALRKAKKEARRKVLLTSTSPIYLGVASPRYTIGSASPRQGLGSNSPRYKYTPYDMNPRRRKHKVKHKKKHREDRDRKHREEEVTSTQDDCDSKEQCITQKLSINLKRLNDTDTSRNASDKMEYISSSDEHSEAVPNFPPLMLRINSQTLPSAIGADGVRLLVGDIVWGKILGFPWWPGKILTITSCSNQGPQAHVAWYGSSTSSLMQCDQLSHYLDNFKVRYSKKKKGPYREAIKQATTEARENAENRVRQPLGNSPSHNIIQIVPPALSSPREIDVAS